MIDARGGRPVLTASSILLAAGLATLALAHSLPVYLVAWLVMGLGMGSGLYDAGFRRRWAARTARTRGARSRPSPCGAASPARSAGRSAPISSTTSAGAAPAAPMPPSTFSSPSRCTPSSCPASGRLPAARPLGAKSGRSLPSSPDRNPADPRVRAPRRGPYPRGGDRLHDRCAPAHNPPGTGTWPRRGSRPRRAGRTLAGRRPHRRDGVRPPLPPDLDHGGLRHPGRQRHPAAARRVPDPGAGPCAVRRRERHRLDREGHPAPRPVRAGRLRLAHGAGWRCPACSPRRSRPRWERS